jgi:hypothetical protein
VLLRLNFKERRVSSRTQAIISRKKQLEISSKKMKDSKEK